MTNQMKTYNTKFKLRNSGIVFSLIFFIIFFLIPFLRHQEFRPIVFLFTIIILSLSFISPLALRKPYDLWIKFGKFLGNVNSKIILILFFYILISPIAIIIRIFNKVFSNKKMKTFYVQSMVNFKDFNFKEKF